MDKAINKFRIASRELFNNFFLDSLCAADKKFEILEYFDFVQQSLFSALVSMPHELNEVIYGYLQPEILVKPTSDGGIPIMLNREVDSGYWDHPINRAVTGANFTFISFFDWEETSYMDNRYVRVLVRAWPGDETLVGKHALIETHYITYEKTLPR